MGNRELDAMIASRILNQVVVLDNKTDELYTIRDDRSKYQVPEFSSDEDATSALEEYMADKGFEMRARKSGAGDGALWFVVFSKDINGVGRASHGSSRGVAVCNAALATIA